MRIHYGKEKDSSEGAGHSSELYSAKLPQQGKRVTVRSSGAGRTGVHVRVPEENFSDFSGVNRKPGGCSVCQMAGNTLASGEIFQEKERAVLQKFVTGVEPGFCTLRLPAGAAGYLGKLLLEAATAAEEKSSQEVSEEELPDKNRKASEEKNNDRWEEEEHS